MPDDFIPIEWITTAEAAELTGYNLEYIRQMIRSGVIVAEKKGLSQRIETVDLSAHCGYTVHAD